MHTHAGWEGQGRIHGGGHGTGWTFSDQCQRYVHRRLASSLWRVEPARGFFFFFFLFFFLNDMYVGASLLLYGEWSRQEVFSLFSFFSSYISASSFSMESGVGKRFFSLSFFSSFFFLISLFFLINVNGMLIRAFALLLLRRPLPHTKKK